MTIGFRTVRWKIFKFPVLDIYVRISIRFQVNEIEIFLANEIN